MSKHGSPPPAADDPGSPEYDLFVICAQDDEAFVSDFLLPELELPPGRVLLNNELTPGASVIGEIERGVMRSTVTVVVLSPAYLRDRWTEFGDHLAGFAGGSEPRLIPLILKDCDIPLRLTFRVALDFRDRDPARWRNETRRLREALHLRTIQKAAAPRDDAPPDGPSWGPRDLGVTAIVGKLYPSSEPFRAVARDAISGYGRDSILPPTAVSFKFSLAITPEGEVSAIVPSGISSAPALAACVMNAFRGRRFDRTWTGAAGDVEIDVYLSAPRMGR